MDLFLLLLKQNKLPKPIPEYKFCETRKWRFDFAFEKQKVAVEQEGAVWVRGRHTRGSGFVKDMEKYNAAALLGWRVLRYTPDQMFTEAIEDLKKILKK
jgi:very-short-patch-repair endonuclease